MNTEVVATDPADLADMPPITDAAQPSPRLGAKLRQKRSEREEPTVRMSAPERQLETEESKSLADWFRSLSIDAAIRVVLTRTEPKEIVDPSTRRIVKTDGQLYSFDRTVEEDEIRRKYGGGSYTLKVLRDNGKGQYVYFKQRRLEIAGDPLLTGLSAALPEAPPVVQAPASSDGPVMLRMMDMLGKQVERLSQNPPANDGSALAAALAPMQAMIQQLQQQLAAKDQAIIEARKGDPQEVSFREKMISTFIDQDSVRLNAVRSSYDSEIRQLKAAHIEDEKRIRDQHARDLEQATRAHEREIRSLTESHARTTDSAKAAHDLTVRMLEGENKRLDRELTELRSEVKELRNKKDPSLKDRLDEINSIKELVGGDETEDKGTITKIVEGLAGSDKVQQFAGRLMGGGAAPPVPPAQQQAVIAAQQAARNSRRTRIVVDRRTNQRYATDGVQIAPVVKTVAPPGEQAALTTPAAPVIPYLEPADVTRAVDYMLNAFRNNTDPQAFAETIRPHITAEMLTAIRDLGVDDFLGKVAQLDGTHLLRTQAGRNWTTKVAKVLVG